MTGNLFGGAIDTALPASSDYWKRDNLFSLRYCNWNKDMFMGILPNSQFGDIAEYRDWETDRKSTRLNSSHSAKSRMPSSA